MKLPYFFNFISSVCVISIPMFISACGSPEKKVEKIEGTKIEGTTLTNYCNHVNSNLPSEDFMGNYTDCQYEPIIINDDAILYSQPDSVSKIKSLSIGDPVTILMYGNQEIVPDSTVLYPDSDITVKYDRYWFKVKTGNSIGYVRGDDIAEIAFPDPDNKFKYLVSKNPAFKGFFSLYKFDISSKRIVQTKKMEIEPYGSVTLVSIVKNHTLKNVKTLIRINTSGETEGAASEKIFIADIGNKFVSLPISYGVGDVDYSDEVVLYLPFRMTDGTIQLVANMGDEEYPKPLAVPTDLQIPIEELLIVKEDHGSWESNDQGERIGKPSITKKTTYYRWDGTKAFKIK